MLAVAAALALSCACPAEEYLQLRTGIEVRNPKSGETDYIVSVRPVTGSTVEMSYVHFTRGFPVTYTVYYQKGSPVFLGRVLGKVTDFTYNMVTVEEGE